MDKSYEKIREQKTLNILVTGGSGYIGSHVCVELLNAGCNVFVVDNLSNGKQKYIDEIKNITGKHVTFRRGDIRDEKVLNKIFSQDEIHAVVHLAGLKAVGDSMKNPLEYYDNNVGGTISLLQAMKKHKCHNLIFSSSAAVYGSAISPVTEKTPLQPTSVYGKTKVQIEEILEDLSQSDEKWKITILRYFNPVGAHKSGRIGEDPTVVNNLVPYISQVAVGKLPHLNLFGTDYKTDDGTGVRDYIHVVDLAKGHVRALCHNLNEKKENLNVYNLGTGKGHSVIEVIKEFVEVCGNEIKVNVTGRRPGDVAELYADCTKANKELDWKAKLTLKDMLEDTWRFVCKNKK